MMGICIRGTGRIPDEYIIITVAIAISGPESQEHISNAVIVVSGTVADDGVLIRCPKVEAP